jgi:hypothetical protein
MVVFVLLNTSGFFWEFTLAEPKEKSREDKKFATFVF